MLRLVINIFYAMLWLALIGIAILIAALVLLICIAWPPMFVVTGIVITFFIISHRRNLGVKGIQSVFPAFLHRPKGRIMNLMR